MQLLSQFVAKIFIQFDRFEWCNNNAPALSCIHVHMCACFIKKERKKQLQYETNLFTCFSIGVLTTIVYFLPYTQPCLLQNLQAYKSNLRILSQRQSEYILQARLVGCSESYTTSAINCGINSPPVIGMKVRKQINVICKQR